MGQQRRRFTPEFKQEAWTCADVLERVSVRWYES